MAINKNFSIKHGLEVNQDLVYADVDTKRVGINTDNPEYNLHVVGGIGVTDISASGLSSLANVNIISANIDSGIITATSLNTQSFNVSGVSTFSDINLSGSVSIAGTSGADGQVLSSTGTGVTWKAVSSPRTSTVYSAGIGSTSFSVSYEVGLIDTYINGVRLVPPPSPYAEFTASNGSVVFLNDACFGGEIVEFVVYNQL